MKKFQKLYLGQSWARVGKNNNPCIFLNIDGYYDSLKNYYDDMVKNGFLSESDRSKVLFADYFDEIDKFIKEYEPPVVRQYKK